MPKEQPMTTTGTAERRAEAVARAMDDIRRIEADLGVTRPGVEAIRDRLVDLAAERDLFPPADFPGPGAEAAERSRLYRLAQDEDDRFALYAQRSTGAVATPAHNHTTWAVVVGFEGQELNRFYRRANADDQPGDQAGDQRGDAGGDPVGVVETHRHVVEAGTGVAMLPDDLHSIHIDGPSLNFHCYGLALERLDERVFYDARNHEWRLFSSVSTIEEARPGRVPAESC